MGNNNMFLPAITRYVFLTRKMKYTILFLLTHIHTYTHTHAHKHTLTHTHTNTHSHTRTQTHTHTHQQSNKYIDNKNATQKRYTSFGGAPLSLTHG